MQTFYVCDVPATIHDISPGATAIWPISNSTVLDQKIQLKARGRRGLSGAIVIRKTKQTLNQNWLKLEFVPATITEPGSNRKQNQNIQFNVTATEIIPEMFHIYNESEILWVIDYDSWK